jgi:oligopeptide/dipeptide ABC transporter ATP-binding protein
MKDVPTLEVQALVKEFPLGRGQVVHAVNNVSFAIQKGEALGLVGESGSGKTTVGRCILRLIAPTSGSILFHGQEVTSIPTGEFRKLRSRIQLVFQDPYGSLNPRMRVGRIIEEPLLLAQAMPAAQRQERVRALLDMVRLGAGYHDKYPHQLSDGEQQRVGIARALSTNPELVVLDEPTSSLDVSVRAEILNLLSDLQQELGLSYLFISHDLTAVRRVCHRIAIMYLGKIVEIGETEALFQQPLHPYARALLSSVLYPNPRQQRSRFLLKGEIPSPIDLPTGCHLHTRCPLATPECIVTYPPVKEHLPGRFLSCFHATEEGVV